MHCRHWGPKYALEKIKISFEVQKLTFEGCFKTKMTLKTFWNIPGSFRLDFISNSYYFKTTSVNIKENPGLAFKCKIPHFYRLWGAYLFFIRVGHHLRTLEGPGTPLWSLSGDHWVQWCMREGPWMSQHRFSSIFYDFLETCWGHFGVTFLQFMWFEASKSMFGLQARFLMIFDWKNLWFLMSQPLKNIVNTMVFIRSHFSCIFVILMLSGTSWDLILESFGGLQAPFWWFLRVLENHRNFIEFYDLAGWPQSPATLSRGW